MLTNRNFSTRLAIALLVPILLQAGAFLALRLLGAGDQSLTLLLINLAFLLACLLCILWLRLSSRDIGLEFLPASFSRHAVFSLGLLLLYLSYYLLGVRISGLRPFTASTAWTLLGYLVVAFTEELYFRGILYALFFKKYSGRAAVLWTAIIFAFFHLRQGPAALLRLPTGLLWGSVRYSTGMIFLLAFPLHFAYNAVWLLFEGNWENQPVWSYLIPLIELGLCLLILRLPASISPRGQEPA